MIKNKTLNIKLFLKQVKNILNFQINFCFTKINEQFLKTVIKNNFFRIVLKNNYQTYPYFLGIFLL